MELAIAKKFNGVLSVNVEDYVTDQLSRNGFDPSEYTNVMYILPAVVDFEGSAAYAYLNGYLSVFLNDYASMPYVLMHEIGHNLGQHHSGEGISDYGDDSCMMGVQKYAENAPRSCFNGAKSWWFNWYSDRHAVVTPTSKSMVLHMLSIDDYLNGQANSENQYTIARIVESNETDLFVMYNRAEGVNSEVAGHRDQVTIVRQQKSTSPSWFEAGLDESSSSEWTKSNWNGSGYILVVQFCERVADTPDYARVIIYLRGINDLSCDSNLPDPSTKCSSDESRFKAGVRTDSRGNETGWWLKERNGTGSFSRHVLRDSYLPSNKYSSRGICIQKNACYKFKIRDEGEDGICCNYGDGWYHIKVDGRRLRSKPSYKHVFFSYIRIISTQCCTISFSLQTNQ